jgi:hypothetical protein
MTGCRRMNKEFKRTLPMPSAAFCHHIMLGVRVALPDLTERECPSPPTCPVPAWMLSLDIAGGEGIDVWDGNRRSD